MIWDGDKKNLPAGLRYCESGKLPPLDTRMRLASIKRVPLSRFYTPMRRTNGDLYLDTQVLWQGCACFAALIARDLSGSRALVIAVLPASIIDEATGGEGVSPRTEDPSLSQQDAGLYAAISL